MKASPAWNQDTAPRRYINDVGRLIAARSVLEVLRRSSAERLSECGNECARCAVAGVEGVVRDLRACSEESHGMHKVQLLAPFAKRHSRRAHEEALNGPPAGAAAHCDR